MQHLFFMEKNPGNQTEVNTYVYQMFCVNLEDLGLMYDNIRGYSDCSFENDENLFKLI